MKRFKAPSRKSILSTEKVVDIIESASKDNVADLFRVCTHPGILGMASIGHGNLVQAGTTSATSATVFDWVEVVNNGNTYRIYKSGKITGPDWRDDIDFNNFLYNNNWPYLTISGPLNVSNSGSSAIGETRNNVALDGGFSSGSGTYTLAGPSGFRKGEVLRCVVPMTMSTSPGNVTIDVTFGDDTAQSVTAITTSSVNEEVFAFCDLTIGARTALADQDQITVQVSGDNATAQRPIIYQERYDFQVCPQIVGNDLFISVGPGVATLDDNSYVHVDSHTGLFSDPFVPEVCVWVEPLELGDIERAVTKGRDVSQRTFIERQLAGRVRCGESFPDSKFMPLAKITTEYTV